MGFVSNMLKPTKQEDIKKARQKKADNNGNTTVTSIPYTNVFKNGIFCVLNHRYSRVYRINDINFKMSDLPMQNDIADQYSTFMGSFDDDVEIQVTLYNKKIALNEFKKNLLIKLHNDDLDVYRQELNEMLLEKLQSERNGLITEIYLTISLDAMNIQEASNRFFQIDAAVMDQMSAMTKTECIPLTLEERIDLLNSIYKNEPTGKYVGTIMVDGVERPKFSIDDCKAQGISSKHVIAPQKMTVGEKEIDLGKQFSRSYYFSYLPPWIKADVLTSLTKIPTNLLVTNTFNKIPTKDAINMVKANRSNIAGEIIDVQKDAAKQGIDASLIAPAKTEAEEEARGLLEGLTKDNMYLGTCVTVVTLFAETKEKLNDYETQMNSILNQSQVQAYVLDGRQIFGLNSSLPNGWCQIENQKLITNQTIEAMLPFNSKTINDVNGSYYGLHPQTGMPIVLNRKNLTNPNGAILGKPGGGKSFASKREIAMAILGSDDEVYVIDPENEYSKLAEAFHGTVIKISNSSQNHINPFDMHLDNADDGEDPIATKIAFIETIMEIAVGGRFGLSPIEKSVIDRCVIAVYEPYIEYLNKTGKSIDTDKAPTLTDFYHALRDDPQGEAANLAYALERYVTGGSNVFAHKTNVNINNRFTVFNIKDLGGGLRELGLQICLDHIWNKMIENDKEGKKKTWIYIDEFYLLMQKPNAAQYTAMIWKRARKWGGIPTAITQNCEDLLKNEEARTVLNNSSFCMMLMQAPINQGSLKGIYSMSDSEADYLNRSKPGMGVMNMDGINIPFNDDFPRHTKLYKLFTTKSDEKLR